MAIAFNQPVTFGQNGSARSLNCTGIDFSEHADRSWTNALVAELDIQLPPSRQAVVVEIEAAPFTVPGVLTSQQLFIFLGGLFAGYGRFADKATLSFPLSRNIGTNRLARMALVVPDAASPSDMGLNEDQRLLGICLTSITFIGSP